MMKGMVFAERYKLVDFIGEGGMSLVYRAVDIRTGHSVAVKILKSEYNSDSEFLERFQREAHAASLMSHHNIVNLLDVGAEGEYRYLVLEYVSGNTLKQIIRQKGCLSTNTAIQITIRILSALQHAHDNGIIHRDIKPQNILVHSDGHVKVADFGIARMTSALTISKGDTVVGSVHYSSPEQASGAVVDSTSDIYSTGVVLYEMLTGHVPFTGDTPVAVAMQHIKAVPPPISDYNPDVPPAIVGVVMRALEKSPRKRYQSAREMAEALAKARDGKEEPLTLPLAAGTCGPGKAKTTPNGQDQRTGESRGTGAQTGRAGTSRSQARHRPAWWLTVLLVVAVLGVLALGIIQIYNQVATSAVAPELVDLPLEEAQNLARRAGLNLQKTEINHDTIPAGVVISQIPEPDTPMVKGDSVVITLSLGPLTSLAPNLLGMPLEEASAKLKEKGLGMVVFKIASSEPLDRVISQNPQAGQPCPLGTEVEITISGGSTMVPDVSGMTYDEAAALLQENRITVSKLEYVEVEDQKIIGQVVAQSPTAGTLAILGAQATLTLAKKSKAYHSQVNVSLPASAQSRSIRVALVEDGKEVEQLSSVVPASQTVTSLLVPLSSDLEGTLVYRVYVNDMLWDESEVQLQ